MGKGRKKHKIGRNDPCPCGSGKKYKRCCMKKDKEINSKPKNDSNEGTSENKLIVDNPSIKKMEKTLDNMKKLRTAVEIGLLDFLVPLGLDKGELSDVLSKVDELEKDFEQLHIPDRFNEHFSKNGWIAHESMSQEMMIKSVELADNGKLEEAEQGLIEYYSKNIQLLIQWSSWMEEFKPRMSLLERAFDYYTKEMYSACIPILLTIIDGIVFDNKETGNKGFFGEDNKIIAEDSIAAHITGLPELQSLMSFPRTETTTYELTIPFRNGILHGRDLSFANKMVATKSWATLFALKDGIIALKKDKIPEDSEKTDFKTILYKIKKNELRNNLLNIWKPRKNVPIDDFVISGSSSDYTEGSPEKELVEFFEYWQDRNFGFIANKMDHRTLNSYSIGKIAGIFSREIFSDKKLVSYKILSIIDEAPAISEITSELTIQKDENIISKEITFRMIYEDDEGEIEIRTMGNGSWKFISCFSEIGNI